MEAADLADRVQAAADKVPVVDLADRIEGIIDNLTRQIKEEHDPSTVPNQNPNRV